MMALVKIMVMLPLGVSKQINRNMNINAIRHPSSLFPFSCITSHVPFPFIISPFSTLMPHLPCPCTISPLSCIMPHSASFLRYILSYSVLRCHASFLTSLSSCLLFPSPFSFPFLTVLSPFPSLLSRFSVLRSHFSLPFLLSPFSSLVSLSPLSIFLPCCARTAMIIPMAYIKRLTACPETL